MNNPNLCRKLHILKYQECIYECTSTIAVNVIPHYYQYIEYESQVQ